MGGRNGRLALILATVGAVMVGSAFAAVPLYNLFCRVTGFGGTTGVAEQASEVVLDRTVTVRFDGSTAQGMPWQFAPEVPEMELRIGETGLAYFVATNTTDRVVAGTATYNVTPYSAGGYFTKIACFCFTEQVLAPGESARMPVTFFVDPEIVDDPEAGYVTEITLSYTFFETDLPESYATAPDSPATAAAGSGIN